MRIKSSFSRLKQSTETVMHFIKRHYTTCLLFYLALLCCVVFLTLWLVFAFLPSNGTFSLIINRKEIEKEAVFSNIKGMNADFYGKEIAFTVKNTEEGFIKSTENIFFKLYGNNSLILIDQEGNRHSTDNMDVEVNVSNVDGDTHFVFLDDPSLDNTQTKDSPLLSMKPSYNMVLNPSMLLKTDAQDKTSIAFHGKQTGSYITYFPDLTVKGNSEIVFDYPVYATLTESTFDDHNTHGFIIKKIIVPSFGADISVCYLNDHVRDSSSDDSDLSIEFYFEDTETDYNISALDVRSSEIIGDGTLYYSFLSSTKEYPIHMQSVQLDKCKARLSIQKKQNNLSITINGIADKIIRSGTSIKPSVMNWISESLAIIPTAILTVFGGAITISLKMWEREHSDKKTKHKKVSQSETDGESDSSL